MNDSAERGGRERREDQCESIVIIKSRENLPRIPCDNNAVPDNEKDNSVCSLYINSENNSSNPLPNESLSISLESNDNNKNGRKNSQLLNFGLTNARSLWNKIYSLYDSFEELDLSFAVVTETWFHQCPALEKLETDALHGNNLGAINYVRKVDGNKNRGGGVSIFFNKSKISFVKYNVKTSSREIVVARGKIVRNSRPFFVVAGYISTRLKPKQVQDFVENLCHIILKIKTENTDPYIIIMGDFNGADTSPIMSDFPDLSCKTSLPTRNDAILDYSIANFWDELQEVSVRKPLENYASGTKSDHSFLFYKASLKHVHKFEWVTSSARVMKEKNIAKAAERINNTVWEQELPTLLDPDEYVQAFHALIIRICDEEMPWKQNKRRSTDDPWINEKIARMIRRRKRVFKREERSPKWRKLKKVTDSMVRSARKKYYQKEVEKLRQPGMLPFKVIKGMKDKERPPAWTLSDVFPEDEQNTVREKAATFFNRISSEFEPLQEGDIPRTFDRQVRILSVTEICETLQSMKKPKSHVSIDLPQAVLSRCYESIASAIAPVVNLTRTGGWWPRIWKAEEVSVIPKSSNPDSLDQTRNISCTSILSKLAETFLLERLNQEIKLPENQFGGKKGVGTDHLLSELTTDIMRGLDDGLSCATVMSLDFAKAFNRMSHQHCLLSLAKMGASNQTISTVYAFLKQRTMRVKFNQKFSTPRQCNGGAPQGTKIGNFLFSATIASFNLDIGRGDLISEDSFNMSTGGGESDGSDQINLSKFDRTTDFSFNLGRYDRRTRRVTNPLDETPAHPYLRFSVGDLDGQGVDETTFEKITTEYNYVDDQTVVEIIPV